LGVLAGEDLNILNDITGDPDAIFSLGSTQETRLKSLNENMIDNFNTKATAYNFRPFGQKEIINIIPNVKYDNINSKQIDPSGLNTPQNQNIWGAVNASQ